MNNTIDISAATFRDLDILKGVYSRLFATTTDDNGTVVPTEVSEDFIIRRLLSHLDRVDPEAYSEMCIAKGEVTPARATFNVTFSSDELPLVLEYIGGHKRRNLKKGLAGIREVFMCSQSSAFKIAHSEWFRPAIIKPGSHIIFDADIARAAARKEGHQN